MIILRLTLLFFLVMAAIATRVYAVPVSGLYDVEIWVADRSTDARMNAFSNGLALVVDRLTGQPGWRSVVAEDFLTDNPQRFVEQYSYQRLEGVQGLDWVLTIKYSGVALKNVLQSQGVAFWGESRPQMLIWLAAEENNRRRVVAEGAGGEFNRYLAAGAKHWGVPMVLPLMDLDDQRNLDVSDLWGFFSTGVEQASRRYPHDAVVMARVRPAAGGRWAGIWQLRIGNQLQEQGEIVAEDKKEWSDQLFAALAQAFSGKYSVAAGAASRQISLEVSGVNSFRDYVDITRILESLPPVSRAQATIITPTEIRFQLEGSGSINQITEHLALKQSLVARIGSGRVSEAGLGPDTAAGDSALAADLLYEWQPRR